MRFPHERFLFKMRNGEIVLTGDQSLSKIYLCSYIMINLNLLAYIAPDNSFGLTVDDSVSGFTQDVPRNWVVIPNGRK